MKNHQQAFRIPQFSENNSQLFSRSWSRDCNDSAWKGAESVILNAKEEEIFPARYAQINAIMNDLIENCSVEDWDCEGSKPIRRDSKNSAHHFLLYTLPESFPIPAVSCDPYGNILIEWHWENGAAAVAFNPERSYFVFGYSRRYNRISFKTSDARSALQELKKVLFT